MEGFTGTGDLETAAMQVIRDYCGWHIGPEITETLVLDGTGSPRLLLPTKKVAEVTQVLVAGEPVTYRWSAHGWLTLVQARFPDRERSVTVTLRHGYTSPGVLDLLAALASGIAARARMSPTGAVVHQRAGTQSATYASFRGAVASLPLLETEKAALAPYRITWGM